MIFFAPKRGDGTVENFFKKGVDSQIQPWYDGFASSKRGNDLSLYNSLSEKE